MFFTIKEDQDEYLDMENVKYVIQKYTQIISFPIELQETREVEVDEEVSEVEGEETKVEEESKEKITETVTEWNVVNKQKPIWCRKPDTVTEEELSRIL